MAICWFTIYIWIVGSWSSRQKEKIYIIEHKFRVQDNKDSISLLIKKLIKEKENIQIARSSSFVYLIIILQLSINQQIAICTVFTQFILYIYSIYIYKIYTVYIFTFIYMLLMFVSYYTRVLNG